jgi:hypothetical protein
MDITESLRLTVATARPVPTSVIVNAFLKKLPCVHQKHKEQNGTATKNIEQTQRNEQTKSQVEKSQAL